VKAQGRASAIEYDGRLSLAVKHQRLIREQALLLVEICREVEQPLPAAGGTARGDAVRLRGLPAVGRGVQGAIRGSVPHAEILKLKQAESLGRFQGVPVSVNVAPQLYGDLYALAELEGRIMPGHVDAVDRLVAEALGAYVTEHRQAIAKHREAKEQAENEAIQEQHRVAEEAIAVGQGRTVEEVRERRAKGIL
jgi:hypothetical protein